MLSIIRRSPADAQPVFEAIVQSAARLCDAIFSVAYLIENDGLRVAATKNFSTEATNQIHKRQELRRISRSFVGGRAVLDRAIVHVPDVLEDSSIRVSSRWPEGGGLCSQFPFSTRENLLEP